MGEAPPPFELQLFLAATGERAVPWFLIFGDAPMTLRQFELVQFMQQRLALVSSGEEGRKRLAEERAIERALEREARGELPMPAEAIPPFDPEVMTAEEVSAWLHKYGQQN